MSGSPEAHAVRSEDGTTLGVWRLGSGPPLVLVHGSLDTHEGWLPVASGLAGRFTCHLLDRRGRGASGDAADYAIAREVDDVAAVLDFAGDGACLLGHSFGAICALEAARRRRVRRLVVYEPPLRLPRDVLAHTTREVAEAMERGDPDEGIARFLRGGPALTEEEVSILRTTPIWERMQGAAPTLVRELEAVETLPEDLERLREVTAPTLLLVGSASPARLIEGSRAVERALPDARTHALEGQAHVANLLAPDAVARAVAGFLASGASP